MAKILILDDDLNVCQQVRTLLQADGHEVSFLINPQVLWVRLETETFDIIMLDINMPGSNGLDVLTRLKKHEPFNKVPVVMLTGAREDKMLADCFVLGAADYVSKPIRELVLISRVNAVLATTHEKRRAEQLLNALNSLNENLETKVEERTARLKESKNKMKKEMIARQRAEQTTMEQNRELHKAYLELDNVSRMFERFVPKPFLKSIRAASFRSGQYHEEKLTILFLDIRAYTTLSEKMSPEENFRFLNEFFQRTEPIISENNGFVDKYIGDAIMALFDGENAAENAIRAAVRIHAEVSDYSHSLTLKGGQAVHIGIGINSGKVMVGALGSANRLNSTVIGDHVNVAARLEELTKRYRVRILISQHTLEEIPGHNFLIRPVDSLQFRGRQRTERIFEVFEADPVEIKRIKLKNLDMFCSGLDLYCEKRFGEAGKIFNEYLKRFPFDGLAMDYLIRCTHLIQQPPSSASWEVEVANPEQLLRRLYRQRADRFHLEISAELSYSVNAMYHLFSHSMDARCTVLIRNISETGVKIQLENALNPGDIVLIDPDIKKLAEKHSLKPLSIQIFGYTVWCDLLPGDQKPSSWAAGLLIFFLSEEQKRYWLKLLNSCEAKESRGETPNPSQPAAVSQSGPDSAEMIASMDIGRAGESYE